MENKTSESLGQNGETLPASQVPPPLHRYLPRMAEEYLRESANIEDLPTPEEDSVIDKLISRIRKGKK